jgi:hypothetical protein
MASPKRTKEQREYDLKEISSLYLQGWIQAEIAAHINKARSYDITQQTISRDIKTIQQRWLESSVRNFDEARAQELAKIDNLELTYWSQFEASKDPIIKRKTAKKVDGQTTEATQEVSLGTGDPRFLQGVQWCIERRCKLLGFDAAIKQDLDLTSGGQSIDSALDALISKSYGNNSD